MSDDALIVIMITLLVLFLLATLVDRALDAIERWIKKMRRKAS